MKKSISIIAAILLIVTFIIPNTTLAADENADSIKNDLYTITLPEWAKVLNASNTDEYITVLSDNELNFTAKIWFEKISDVDLNTIRDYIGDYTSDDTALYNEIVDLKASSYDAVEKSFKNSSLFYPLKKDYSEFDFKIIDTQIQTLFGVRSYGIMYNTLDATLNNVSEYSKTDFVIPSPINGGIFNINIIIPRDNLNYGIVMKLGGIITSLSLKGHVAEDKVPLVFFANNSLQNSSAGIYPAFTFKNYNLKPFNRKDMGLSFLYPDFLIPTDEVNTFSDLQTASFKIDPFTTFNVNVSDSKFFSMNDAIAAAFTSTDGEQITSRTSILESPNGNIFEIRQNFNSNNIDYKKYTYILSSHGNTVTYTFTTSAKNPTYSLDNIAVRILMTTKISEKTVENAVQSFTYKTADLGRTQVELPSDFEIEDIGGKYKKITSPDIGTFKIYVYEEELTRNINFTASSKLANYDYSTIEKLIKNTFYIPYNSVHSTYLGSNFDYKDGISKINSLSKYLDENNRVHYCYTVSLSKEDKIYSMLIDVNSLLFKEDGKVGRTVPQLLNEIAQSFRLK